MKKILTSIAMVLLLAGCAKQYDDSAIQTKIADLERRVTSLESSVDALRSAIGEGVYVVKVQEYADPDTGKVIGITVTYSNGDVKYFEITPKVDYAGPVVSIIKNGAGDLVWAVDGVAIKDANGKDVTVYQTPVFTIDGDGNLLVSIDGSDPVVLGQVQNEGATLVDGIFTDIKVLEDKIVLTLSDNSVVNIPYTPFKLKIETTDFVFDKKGDVIEIPYTVTGGAAATTVEVTGYNPNDFVVEVTEEKIIVTPLDDSVAAVMAVHAQSEAGFYSMVKIEVNHGVARVLNPNIDNIVTDFVVDAEGGALVANVVSNVLFDAVPDAESNWITVVETKAMEAHTITMEIAPNTSKDVRNGCVDLYKKGTDIIIYSIFIDQNGFVPGPKDLSKNGAANCYIIPATVEGGSQFKFKTVKGNSTESVGTVAKAEVFWETWNISDTPTKNSVVAAASYADGYVTITMPETPHTGNAVVAVRDASDVILWSWHIWVPADEVAADPAGASMVGGTILDRNLGALIAPTASETPLTVEALGLYYQWGRKDPFLGPKDFSDYPSKVGVAGAAFTKDANQRTVEYGIANPNVYSYGAGSCDWLTEPVADLWEKDGKKTIYDPCPVGYKVPQYDNALPMWKKTNDNWTFSDNFWMTNSASTSVFALAGYIDDGNGSVVMKKRAFYWSSKEYTDHIRAYGADVRAPSYNGEKTYKARGASVRCVAE